MMALVQENTSVAGPEQLAAPVRIAICGEISSGKSAVLQALLCETCLPDFFGIEDRPIIRLITGAETDEVTVTMADGASEVFTSLAEVTPDTGMQEIRVSRVAPSPFGACELVEMPALRDGHLSEDEVEEIAGCDILVWVTIGSQAWRLSEKTILDEIGERRPSKGVLVVSRGDKFRSEDDRERLMDRMKRETESYFQSCVLMAAAPKKIAASEADFEAWSETGARALASALVAASQSSTDSTDSTDDQDVAETNVVEFSSVHSTKTTEESVDHDDIAAELETIRAEAASVESVEADEADTQPVVADVPQTPENQLQQFVETLHGVLAIGQVDRSEPDTVSTVFGGKKDVQNFAQFCLGSANTLVEIAGFGGMDPHPEGEQITMENHQVIYRLDGNEILFMVSESSKISTGIARTAFARLTRYYDAVQS